MKMHLFITELGKLGKVLHKTVAWTLPNVGNQCLGRALDLRGLCQHLQQNILLITPHPAWLALLSALAFVSSWFLIALTAFPLSCFCLEDAGKGFKRKEHTLGQLEQLSTCTEHSNKSKSLRYVYIYLKFLSFIYVFKNIYKLFCSE